MNDEVQHVVARAISGLVDRIEVAEKRLTVLEGAVQVALRPATKQDLLEMEKRLMMTSDQLETLLNNQTTQIGKIAKEQADRFDTLTAAFNALQALIDAGGTISAKVETAAANVQAALDSLDAAVPDAPPTP